MKLSTAQDAPAADSDEALLAAYGQGGARAAQALADRLLPRVLGFATRMLGGDRAEAEDVAQEAMLRLWRIAPDWHAGEAKVSTWLYRVTSNLCTDRLRKSGRARPLDDAGEPVDPTPGVVAALEDGDRARALQEALSALPDRQRQAVVMRHLDGCSNPEIAQAMDMSVEAVECLTARGKRALAALLAGRRAELGFEG
ncbi:MAG: RNA polymerase sigma factor [Rhodobacteraceae bacterium]|nr:RNA polymerase sigma factor [Paracoccaceae bacterium]